MRAALLGGDMERKSQVLFLEVAAVEEEEEEEEGVENLRRWTS